MKHSILSEKLASGKSRESDRRKVSVVNKGILVLGGLVTLSLGFSVTICAAETQKATTLQQQIEIIRAKYRNAKSSPLIQETAEEYAPFYSIEIGDKYGYMMTSGKIVIPPKFKWADRFSEGMALVQLAAPGTTVDRGFIDRTGKVLFRANLPSNDQYNRSHVLMTQVDSFHSGVARVEIRDSRGVSFWGYIDRKGRLAIAADFEDAKDFSEGVAAVTIASPNDFSQVAAGFIYPTGQFALEPTFEDTQNFSESIAGVRDHVTHKWGYVDHTGAYLI